MPIQRLNHAVLYVRDVDAQRRLLHATRSASGSTDVPGRARRSCRPPGSTNDHDLGLFEIGERRGRRPAAGRSTVGLYHLAWEVDTLDELERVARAC